MNRTFVGFVRKEFYHILRDRRTLVVLVGMPIVMMILFGFAIRNEIRDVRVAVVDPSRDAATTDIVAALRASDSFEFVGYADDLEAIDEAFRKGRIMVAVVFEPDFGRQLRRNGTARVQVIADASNPNTASTVLAYTTAAVRRVRRSMSGAQAISALAASGSQESRVAAFASPGSQESRAAAFAAPGPQEGRAAAFAASARMLPGRAPVTPEFRMRYNPELKSLYLFVPGLMALLLMLVCALMTSITITREREMGTMEVLLVSPLHPLQIILGKVAPYLVISFVNVITILLLSTLIFRVPVRGSVALLLAEAFLFTLCALSLGILISSRTSSLQTATMIALAGLLMPTVLLSGFIFPIASMPVPLQILSHVVPAKWFLMIVRGIMIRGVGIELIWKETLVVAVMTLFFAAVSMRSFNDRLE